MKKIFFTFCLLALLFFACNTGNIPLNPVQPYLGYRSVNLLTSKGFKFKDLNKNGVLDPYEDWRLSVETRVQDLAKRMTLEEKIGFMLISTTRMKGDWAFEPNAPREEISSGMVE